MAKSQMKKLTTVISCTAIAVLCSGCQPQVLWERFNCSTTKNVYEGMKERTSKGEGPGGFKIYENEAEIKEVLEADTELYSDLWKANNCPGSITEPFNFFAW